MAIIPFSSRSHSASNSHQSFTKMALRTPSPSLQGIKVRFFRIPVLWNDIGIFLFDGFYG
ncbi:hypothetical protein SLEP1_g32569 [Rubroshorea leprosula]|uniref:Uncharacterized protein n=1 Tax=Rubroshorea leprosula TaxID=152421 RepID=A0AAV5KDW5_9ROSI|nr:hypothetical protein SLEP1_g32569 [Rubroshorea leprosula]